MKLSLQKRINYKTARERRKMMIQNEKLHILDSITYDAFLVLYKKYASSISEVEFARYFLDIDWRSYYNLQSGLRKTTSILEREFYDDIEFDAIQKRIIDEEGLRPNDKIDLDRLLYLHVKYGGRFPLKQFAYEVLNVNAHAVFDMNSKKDMKVAVLREHLQTRRQISQIKKDVVRNAGLHIREQITLVRFQELYEEYSKYGINERDFALRVLGISNDYFTRFKSGRRPVAEIWSTFPIDYKAIVTLREKVILEEGLYIEQAISPERFRELFEKYGGVLSEELFAEEILDINIEALKQSRRRNENNIILTGIELTDKYVKELQRKIIAENGISPNNQLMSLGEINELRKKYAPMLTEKRFATIIMGIKYENYIQLSSGATQKNYVFAIQPTPEIQTIRQKIIKSENLHYDDLIDYSRLDSLRRKYAPTMREYIFARFVLDISQVNLDNIRNKEKSYTHILLDEVLPTVGEIEEIRKTLLSKAIFRNLEGINYSAFEKLYRKFGGVMPEDMFSLQVLEITQKQLNRMKEDTEFKTPFLMKGKVDWSEGKYKNARKRKGSENEGQEESKTNKKPKKSLEEIALKIMSDCLDTPNAILCVRSYIEECENLFSSGELRPDQLKTFADAIIYVEAERKHIEVFSKACISFEEYDFCSRNISRNLECNENLTDEDKIKLRTFQDNVRYALRKQKAANMIARGITDVSRIMYITGALEVDILALINKMKEEKLGNTSPGGNGVR